MHIDICVYYDGYLNQQPETPLKLLWLRHSVWPASHPGGTKSMVGWREETNGWNVLKPWIVPSRQRRNLVSLKQFRDVNMCIYIYNHIYIYCIDRVVSTTIWVGPKWYAPNSWSTWLEHTWLDSGGPIFKQTQTCKWGWVRSYDVPSFGVYIYIWIYTNIRYMYPCLLMFIQVFVYNVRVCVNGSLHVYVM